MDLLQSVWNCTINLLFSVNILYTILGCFIGTLAGAMPGIGPASSIALFIPFTFGLNPVTGMVFLCNIYQGCMYGGRITSILANIPGDPAAIVACFDGYPMAQQGRAGAALGISAVGSFVGGMVGLTGLMFLAVPIATYAVQFGPPEYFGLMIFALCCVGILSADAPVKGLTMGILGLLCGTVGHDFVSGGLRMTYGMNVLVDGIELIPLALGVFAISEVLFILAMDDRLGAVITNSRLSLKNLYPSAEDFIRSKWPIVRGSIIGFIIGVLPGVGATTATLVTYGVEKQISKTPEKFGTGMVEGVSGPESADNASEGGALIPMLTLGVPGSGATAILLGGLMIWGIRPGPMLFQENPEFVWYIVAGLLLGNIILFIMNMSLIPMFVSLLKWTEPYMLSAITVMCIAGVYASSRQLSDIWIMFAFGIVGFFARKLSYPIGPLILGLVLGPRTEDSFRQALMMSQGELSILFQWPIAGILLTSGLAIMFYPLAKYAVVSLIKVGRT